MKHFVEIKITYDDQIDDKVFQIGQLLMSHQMPFSLREKQVDDVKITSFDVKPTTSDFFFS